MTHTLTPCLRCRRRTAAPEDKTALEEFVEASEVESTMPRLVLCRECLAELAEILERSESGDPDAKKAFEREQDRILQAMLGIE
jgi:hypothetical protein